MDKRSKIVLSVAVIAFLWTVSLIRAQERQPAGTVATIEALLSEVRQLRLTMERSALLAPRIQVALQKFQMQQSRVDQVSQRLHEFKTRSTATSMQDGRLAHELQQTESQATQVADNAARREIENRAAMLKKEIELMRAQEQQQRAIEMELSNQLRAESIKLEEFVSQLTALEGSLSAASSR